MRSRVHGFLLQSACEDGQRSADRGSHSEKEEVGFMKVRGVKVLFAVIAACLLATAPAFAQGGGASTTGSIAGKVSDTSGGVLPGVTVTAKSPSLMGVQTTVSDTGGNYRFP